MPPGKRPQKWRDKNREEINNFENHLDSFKESSREHSSEHLGRFFLIGGRSLQVVPGHTWPFLKCGLQIHAAGGTPTRHARGTNLFVCQESELTVLVHIACK